MTASRTRVVITGLGAITPLGHNPEEFWQNLLAGNSGVAPVTLFDASKYKTRIAGEVKNFDATQHGIDAKDARRMGRATLFALAATRQAIADAGFGERIDAKNRAGVVLGTGLGGFPQALDELAELQRQGTGRVSPFLAAMILPNMSAFYIAQKFHVRGFNSTIVTTCAAGTDAIGAATAAIQRGDADVMLAGGTDAIISDLVFTAFGAMRALSTRNEEPARACRPFDIDRDGLVISEGAAMVVLEKLEFARARGAKIYAEVIGYAANSDGYHFVASDPEATGAAKAMHEAIQNAGITPEQIDYINAHATSTTLNDPSETVAMKKVFGARAYHIPISATKSMLGHSMGAAGAMEAVACVLTLRDQRIHPTINLEHPDPACDLDYVPMTSRAIDANIVMSNSFGFGGQNATLILKKYSGD